MFRCDGCGQNSVGSPHRRVTELRSVKYDVAIYEVDRIAGHRNSQGFEPAREQNLCDVCASSMRKPSVVEEKVVESTTDVPRGWSRPRRKSGGEG